MPIYEKIPEGLVEGYGGPRTGNETPVTTVSASDYGALSDQPKRGDHGVSPEKPDPKRRRSRSLQPKKVTAPTKQSTPVHEDRCCTCSKTSTCQTKRCACFLGGTPCRSCDCKERCKNLKVIKNPFRVQDTTATGTDESPALAKVLNFGFESPESQNNPPQRGFVSEAETRPAETTPIRDETEPDIGTSEQYKDQAEEQEIGDLPDIHLSDADRMMDKVYGDHVHQNPGTHLRGDIPDDEMWQDYWRRLIVFPSQTYHAPSGAVGRRLIKMLRHASGNSGSKNERRAIHCLPNRRFATVTGGEEGKRREEAAHLAHGCLAVGQILDARSKY
jgi:hypothetical protein